MARKDRENLEQLMAANPRLQEQLEERIAAAVTEARAAWEAEQAAPEEAPEPEEARRMEAVSCSAPWIGFRRRPPWPFSLNWACR